MNNNERELLAPPDRCKTCAQFGQMRSAGTIRSWCATGHPMHVGCTWHREKTPTIIGGFHAA